MSDLTRAFSIALVDFVWQGTVIALVLWVVLLMLRHRSPRIRYAVECAALIALVSIPLVTLFSFWSPVSALSVGATAGASTAVVRGTGAPATMLPIWMVADSPRAGWLSVAQSSALPVWLVGVMVLSLRLAVAWAHSLSAERHATAADGELCARVAALARRLGVRRPVRVLVSRVVDGPGVVGWLKPAILLPPSTAMGLTTAQFEAILTHELAHVLRHDYAVNMLQCVAETLFFYHPAVWWVSRQIRLERELCCDDVVVQTGGNAASYARALTLLARHQLTVSVHVTRPAQALSATGGALSQRVQRLLGLSRPQPLSRASSGIALVAVLLCVLINVNGLRALAQQTPDLAPFVVASVKPNTSGAEQRTISRQGNRITLTGMPIADLIRVAYRVQPLQIVGAPNWSQTEAYDIVATVDVDAARAKWPTLPEPLPLVMRAVLETRFKLAVHRETREMPVFALVFAKSDRSLGPKLHRTIADCTPDPVTGEPKTMPRGRDQEDFACNSSWIHPGGIKVSGVAMPGIAEMFALLTNPSSSLNRLVVDGTGLEGFYNMDLSFTPESALPPPGGPPPASMSGPSLFTAVQEQLGLKLEPRRGPVAVLVIDRVERPSEN